MGVTAGVLGVYLTALVAAAGVVIEAEQLGPGDDTPAWRITFYLEAGKLRMETKSAEGEESITLFDQDKQVVWVIDRIAGTYYEMTPASVQEMQERLDQAKKEMEAQLAQMPPEQRQLVEQMMKQQFGGDVAVTVQERNRGEKVREFVCTRYEVLSGGARSAEVWVAPLEQLQLGAQEFEIFLALGRFFAPLGSSAPITQLGGRLAWEQGGDQMEGFPVRSLTYDEERVVAEERVVRAERRSLEATLFELPSGLRKTELGQEE